MKKFLPLILLIILLGGIGYYLKTKSPSVSPNTQTVSQTMSEAEEFAKAIESGRPTLCTMARNTDKMEYFLKGKKMYVNMTNIIENKTVISHMINDEKYLYLWTDGQKQGSKMNLLTSPLPNASPTATPSSPKFESQSDYEGLKAEGYTINCQASNIDDTAFVPPQDVNFIDPSSLLQQFDLSKLQELQSQYGEEEMETDNP